MRANARRTAWLTGALRDQLERVRQKLASGQRELEGARNAMVLAISMARAAGAPVEDLEVFNATRDAIGESPVMDLPAHVFKEGEGTVDRSDATTKPGGEVAGGFALAAGDLEDARAGIRAGGLREPRHRLGSAGGEVFLAGVDADVVHRSLQRYERESTEVVSSLSV